MSKYHAVICVLVLAAMAIPLGSYADDSTQTGIMVKGALLVPLRSVAEWLGSTVEYDTRTDGITLQTSGTTMLLTLGQTQARIGETPCQLSAPVTERGGTTYVPLRFVAEGFNAAVNWDKQAQRATIVHPDSGETLTVKAPAARTKASRARGRRLTIINSPELSRSLKAKVVSMGAEVSVYSMFTNQGTTYALVFFKGDEIITLGGILFTYTGGDWDWVGWMRWNSGGSLFLMQNINSVGDASEAEFDAMRQKLMVKWIEVGGISRAAARRISDGGSYPPE